MRASVYSSFVFTVSIRNLQDRFRKSFTASFSTTSVGFSERKIISYRYMNVTAILKGVKESSKDLSEQGIAWCVGKNDFVEEH